MAFLSPTWRSLNHPKKVTLNHQEIGDSTNRIEICRISKAGAALTVAISMITSARVQFDGFGVRETQFLNQMDLNKKIRDVIQESSTSFLKQLKVVSV